jgi:hypothetical protein
LASGTCPVGHITTPVAPVAGNAGRFTYPFQRIDGNIDTVNCGNWKKFIAVKDSLCIPPSMTIDTAGRLWIGTVNGLVRCDESEPREYDFRSGPPGMYLTTLVEDTRWTLWLLRDGIALYAARVHQMQYLRGRLSQESHRNENELETVSE